LAWIAETASVGKRALASTSAAAGPATSLAIAMAASTEGCSGALMP
jgi:hypothetical protein